MRVADTKMNFTGGASGICPFKIIIIVMMLYLLMHPNKSEGFHSEHEIKKKAGELYEHREMFQPTTKYSVVKRKIPWIDPVTFTDTYNLARQKNLSISNLESIFK